MGLSLGHSTADTTQSATQANTYTPGQSSLQDSLMAALKTFLPGITGGSISPNVTAMQTQGADQINKTSSGLGDRMQRFLAQRGFGKSGTSGKVALQTELGRQSDLAANQSSASGLQLQQNSSMLSDALKAAFEAIGGTGSGTGSSSSTSLGASLSGAFGHGPGGSAVGLGS